MTGKKFRILGCGLILASVLAVLCWILWPAREPEYDGKSLSSWLADEDWVQSVHGNNRLSTNSTFALQQMGTNALPYLISRMAFRDSALNLKLDSILMYLPGARMLASASSKYDDALRGFDVLGPLGKDAVPDLLRIYRRLPYNEVQREYIAGIFGRIGSAAEPAVADLAWAVLHDPDQEERTCAAYALGKICARPEIAIPALISALGDSVERVRFTAAKALGEFGPAARAAVPILKSWVPPDDGSGDFTFSEAVQNAQIAIENISPSNSELCDLPN